METNKEKATRVMKLWKQFVVEVTGGRPENLVANHIWLWRDYLAQHASALQ